MLYEWGSPVKIEVTAEAAGIDFYGSLMNRFVIETDGISTPFIGYDYSVKNKRRTGGLNSKADLEELSEQVD